MVMHGQERAEAPGDALLRFRQSLLLAQATELARSGRLIEAEALLTNGRKPASAKELDLLARIAAQTRRYDQSERWWKAAAELDADNGAYQEGIRAVAEERTKWARLRRISLWVTVGATALLMALICGLVLGKRVDRADKGGPPKIERKR
jgi:hypothetical protein